MDFGEFGLELLVGILGSGPVMFAGLAGVALYTSSQSREQHTWRLCVRYWQCRAWSRECGFHLVHDAYEMALRYDKASDVPVLQVR